MVFVFTQINLVSFDPYKVVEVLSEMPSFLSTGRLQGSLVHPLPYVVFSHLSIPREWAVELLRNPVD